MRLIKALWIQYSWTPTTLTCTQTYKHGDNSLEMVKASQLVDSKILHIRKQEKQNRDMLSQLTDIALYQARQGVAFRGDDETLASLSRDNFIELLNLFVNYVIKMHLEAVTASHTTKKRPQVSAFT